MYITILCSRSLSRAQLWDVSTPPGGGEVPWWFWAVIWLVYSTQGSFTHVSGILTGIARRWGSPGLPSLHRAAEPPMGSPRRWTGLFTGGSGLPEQVFLETEVEGHSLCLISDVPGPHFCCLLPGKGHTKPKFKWMGKSTQVCKHSQFVIAAWRATEGKETTLVICDQIRCTELIFALPSVSWFRSHSWADVCPSPLLVRWC